MGPAIGIDLGTTYTRVAVFRDGRVEIIENETGRRSTPSYVAFTDKGRLVGDPAKRHALMNPKNTIFEVKRLIGRRFDDPTIKDNMNHWPFEVIEYKDKPMIRARLKGKDESFTPEEICSILLRKMKEIAEKHLGEAVEDAVISVPANFRDSQRQATMDAGRIAGLNVLRIINEPSAAALAYGLQKNLKEVRNILIYDLGGGTIDVSVVKIYAGGSVFEVKATSGDTHLGGEDFDRRIMNSLAQQFEKEQNEKIKDNPRAMRHLRNAAESSKRELSSSCTSSISIDMLFEEKEFTTKISRENLNNICNKLFTRSLNHVENALKDAEMDKNDIDIVVLVGGSTRIPKVQQLLRDNFSGKKINISINPDEAVVYGAAVQAAILSSKRSDFLLIDVAPLSLGYYVIADDIVKQCIQPNTQVPFNHSETFYTIPSLTQYTFPVVEGATDSVPKNTYLGNIDIEVIQQTTKGEIFVNFALDDNGILTVSTEDKSANTVKKITFSKNCLSEKNIGEMLEKFERYSSEENDELERIAMRNSYETLIYEMKARFINGRNVGEEKMCNFLTESFTWLEENPNATKEEYEERKMRLQEEERSIFNELKIDKARKHEDEEEHEATENQFKAEDERDEHKATENQFKAEDERDEHEATENQFKAEDERDEHKATENQFKAEDERYEHKATENQFKAEDERDEHKATENQFKAEDERDEHKATENQFKAEDERDELKATENQYKAGDQRGEEHRNGKRTPSAEERRGKENGLIKSSRAAFDWIRDLF